MNSKELQFISELKSEANESFIRIDDTALKNQEKVLRAFSKYGVATRHFNGTTGYGYNDAGRETLCSIFKEVFDTEDALVSPNLVSGTHTLTVALFGLLKSGDLLLSITGKPYDTLDEVILGKNNGSLKDYRVDYRQVELINDNFDYQEIERVIKESTPKVVFIQRSRGYSWRPALSIEQIDTVVKFIKGLNKDIIIFCDNCYGEFVEDREPTSVGVDVCAGSLIKNIGGGIAPTGGYIAGKSELIEQISYRLTSPSIGNEVGSYAYGYRDFYLGLFIAPHVVAQALKISELFGRAFDRLGYKTSPKIGETSYDIIRSIEFKDENELVSFCKSIQSISPVDSLASPEPWDMPGYKHKVIMAAGCFTEGSSIELSCDSPIREPYIAYLQGGLTLEHGSIALIKCLKDLKKI